LQATVIQHGEDFAVRVGCGADVGAAVGFGVRQEVVGGLDGQHGGGEQEGEEKFFHGGLSFEVGVQVAFCS
jgi:hypothetical protein